MATSQTPSRQRRPPTPPTMTGGRPDRRRALCAPSHAGLELELWVFFDPVAEYLPAVGFVGSAARNFRSLETGRASPDSPTARGNPISGHISHPAAKRHETNRVPGLSGREGQVPLAASPAARRSAPPALADKRSARNPRPRSPIGSRGSTSNPPIPAFAGSFSQPVGLRPLANAYSRHQ